MILNIDHFGFQPQITPVATAYCSEWVGGKRNKIMCDHCKQPLEGEGQRIEEVKGRLVQTCSQYCFARELLSLK